MSIIQEHFDVDGRDFVRTYSNSGRYVVGGDPYDEYEEACDPAEYGRVYTEGDPIGDEISAEEIVGILMGGAE